MQISKVIVPSVQKVVAQVRRLNEVLLGFYLPVLLNGGADNFTTNLMVAIFSHLAELLQLGALLKMFSAGIKIGVIVLIIRFSLHAASKINQRFWGNGKQRNLDEDAIALLYP